MNRKAQAGLAAGYVHSLISPGYIDYSCYARFRRVSPVTGAWIRGSCFEKVFDDEQSAIQWLLSLGCADDMIIICRPCIDLGMV